MVWGLLTGGQLTHQVRANESETTGLAAYRSHQHEPGEPVPGAFQDCESAGCRKGGLSSKRDGRCLELLSFLLFSV